MSEKKPSPKKPPLDATGMVIDVDGREYYAELAIEADGHGVSVEIKSNKRGAHAALHTSREPFAEVREAEAYARRWCEAHAAHEAKIEVARRTAAVEAVEEITKNEAAIAKLEAQRRDLGNAIKGLREANREALARATDPQIPFNFVPELEEAKPAVSADWDLVLNEGDPKYLMVKTHDPYVDQQYSHLCTDTGRLTISLTQHSDGSSVTESAMRTLLELAKRHKVDVNFIDVLCNEGERVYAWVSDGQEAWEPGGLAYHVAPDDVPAHFAKKAPTAVQEYMKRLSERAGGITATPALRPAAPGKKPASTSSKKASAKAPKTTTAKPAKKPKQAGLDPSQVAWPEEGVL